MMSIEQVLVVIIACVVSTACVLPGVFLVLRRMSLMSDAISHSILLGIAGSFVFVKNLYSPWLLLGAVAIGILTVTATELLIHTRRLKKDAAIGLVFPFFFSVGVILLNHYAGDVHIDTHSVLLGEIAFAPFNSFTFHGIEWGPISLWTMGGILLINILFIIIFYKELKVSTFDAALAGTLGFSPALIHYGLMTLVSITAVGAFDAVGSILVVALMITPPATAYLICERLSNMILLSIVLGICSAISGYFVANWLDASIAGSMATMTGLIFVAVLFFSPKSGLFIQYYYRKHQRLVFSAKMLLVQLLDHEGTSLENQENTMSNLTSHMTWAKRFAVQVARFSIEEGWIVRHGDLLKLTPLGRETAKSAMTMS